MGTVSEKLVYLNGTKQAIKQAINEDFEVIDNNTTFREYADEISSNNAKYKDLIPKETKNATNTLDISNSSGLDKALVTLYGNTYQEGEPTPDSPQEIQVVTGDNTIIVSNSDNTQSQSYHVSLGNIELCKIGNYQDYIFKNTQDSPHYDNTLIKDAWYLNKQIGKVVLDGTNNAFASKSGQLGNSYVFYASNFITGPTVNVVPSVLSNKFVPKSWNDRNNYLDNAIMFSYFGTANLNFRFGTSSSLTTLALANAWLINNNVTLYGILATPTTTEITENNYPTLYNQLNNIKLFEGVNHITMTNERGLDVDFDITYYKDWKLD